MRKELADILTAYLMGWKSIRDCDEWLSGIDWDADLDPETQKVVGRMELLITEVLEGLRPELDFWQEASEFVSKESDSLFGKPMSMSYPTIASSSNAIINIPIEIMVEAEPVGQESRFWNISPQLVSGS